MKEVQIDDRKFQIPESWGEVNLALYMRLNETVDDDIDLIASITGMTREEVENSKTEDIDLLILPLLGWMVTDKPDFTVRKNPSRLKIKNKVVDVPSDLSMETYGQKVHATNAITDVFKNYDSSKLEEVKDDKLFIQKFNRLIPFVLAIYLYTKYYEGEKFDYNKAMEFKDKILLPHTNAQEGYAVAYFFLMKLINSMKLKINFLAGTMNKKKSRRRSRGSKNSKTLGLWTPLHKEM